MADQVGAGPRAATWRQWIPARRGPELWWPSAADELARTFIDHVRIWVLAEVSPGRLVPWLAIAFGTGAILYFAADQEPSVWAAGGALIAACCAAAFARRHVILFPLCIAVAAITGGFATATIKRAVIAHPVLKAAASGVTIEGFIETREERERSDRIVVRVTRIEGARLDEAHPLERVRLSVSNGSPRIAAARGSPPPAATPAPVRRRTAPAVGSFVKLKARLSPPLEPVRPGGYDFARDMYFQHVA